MHYKNDITFVEYIYYIDNKKIENETNHCSACIILSITYFCIYLFT